MISCKEASELSIRKRENAISLNQRFQLFVHLVMCGLCKSFDRQSKWIEKAVANLKLKAPFSETEKTELRQKISKSDSSNS
jgi:hypothetical protein